MERNFLCLVLTLLPEGVLAVVRHNFVLETGIIEYEIILERKVDDQTLWPVE